MLYDSEITYVTCNIGILFISLGTSESIALLF